MLGSGQGEWASGREGDVEPRLQRAPESRKTAAAHAGEVSGWDLWEALLAHASGNDDLGGLPVRREAAAPCRRGSWALPEPAGRARGDLYTRAAGRRGQHEQA